MASASDTDPTDLASAWDDAAVPASVHQDFASPFAAVDAVWREAVGARSLSPRMVELVLLAMHASASSINERAIERHVRRAKEAGATDADVIDVLVTITGVATHALYASLPILREELLAAGIDPAPDDDAARAAYDHAKADFLVTRGGFWNPGRDLVASALPRLAAALITLSGEAWRSGSLTLKEREFICIAIDCTVTHSYEPGLRLHITRAIENGATEAELSEVIGLASVLGLEGFLLGAEAIVRSDDPAV